MMNFPPPPIKGSSIEYARSYKIVSALDRFSIIAITDVNGTITYVNEKFCEISKYPREELIGQNHRILKSGYHPPEFFQGMWKAISSGHIWQGVVKNKAKDGTFYWVKTIIVPVHDLRGKISEYVSIRIDITEQKELKENIIMRDDLIFMVSHELRSPLTPIKMYSEMLKDGVLGHLDKDQLEAVNAIYRNCTRLENVVKDLLDIQKLVTYRMRFSEEEFRVDLFMIDLINDFSFTAKSKQIKLINSSREKITVKTDMKRLRQVFDNLIRNAIDFVTSENGEIEIGFRRSGSEIIFYVKDNGHGIPEEAQKNIFNKFYQANTSASRRREGMGLGLAISKAIVENFGGKIWFESKEGVGTTFYFSIPEKMK